MDPRHGSGMAADCSERGGDDWVDLGREEELHSSPVSSHDADGNGVSGVHLHEHEETSHDARDGVHAERVEEQTAARSGKWQTDHRAFIYLCCSRFRKKNHEHLIGQELRQSWYISCKKAKHEIQH